MRSAVMLFIMFFSLKSMAVELVAEKLSTGAHRVIGYKNITEPMLDPMDNCQQGSALIIAKGKVKTHGEFGIFPIVIVNRKAEADVDFREFTRSHREKFLKFIKNNQSYRVKFQACGNAAVISLIDISLIK